MLTVCWAAKGGTGTTVVTASLAIRADGPVRLVDLAGDLPAVLGLTPPTRPGIHDWLRSGADVDKLDDLAIDLATDMTLIPAGSIAAAQFGDDVNERWALLGRYLRESPVRSIIDAGSVQPPDPLHAAADQAWLVTRPCYLGLTAAARQSTRPNGVVLIDEPGRALTAGDVEASLGAPVITTLLLDPAVARAVDAGLLATRLPRAFAKRLPVAA